MGVVVPGVDGAQDQVVPLSTPDGRPIFMRIENDQNEAEISKLEANLKPRIENALNDQEA